MLLSSESFLLVVNAGFLLSRPGPPQPWLCFHISAFLPKWKFGLLPPGFAWPGLLVVIPFG